MNEAHRGKIGHLPKALQEDVNRRLEKGEHGRTVVAWLNALPEVQAVVAAEFAGKPIRVQNLSEWRRHGRQQWLGRQQAWEMAQAMTSTSRERGERRAERGQALEMAQEMNSTPSQPRTDQMAGWVTAHYLLAIRKLVDKNAGGEPDLKTLRAFLQDVVAVRRGDHRGARLQFERERSEQGARSQEQGAGERRETKGEL